MIEDSKRIGSWDRVLCFMRIGCCAGSFSPQAGETLRFLGQQGHTFTFGEARTLLNGTTYPALV